MHYTTFTDLAGNDAVYISTDEFNGQDIAYVTKHVNRFEIHMRDPYHWNPRGRTVYRKTTLGAQSVLDRHLLSIGEDTIPLSEIFK